MCIERNVYAPLPPSPRQQAHPFKVHSVIRKTHSIKKHSREILEDHAGGQEGDLLLPLRVCPIEDSLNVSASESVVIAVANGALQQDADTIRQLIFWERGSEKKG